MPKEMKRPISYGRTECRTKCRCGGKKYDGYDKKQKEWYTECIDCGRKIYPYLLRGIFG